MFSCSSTQLCVKQDAGFLVSANVARNWLLLPDNQRNNLASRDKAEQTKKILVTTDVV